MKLTGKFNVVERLPNSANGNPRFLCMVDGVAFRTAPDSRFTPSITNYQDKIVTVKLRVFYARWTLAEIKEV